jgi:hypothetical protein
MRKWIISSVILLSAILVFFVVKPGESSLQSYYSGDAISYQNNVYISTTNTGSLEVFKLEGKILVLVAKIRPYNSLFSSYGEFFDSKLSEENGHLYVYTVSNYTIYKYEVAGTGLNLVKQSANSYWEWYNRIDKFGNNIATVSAKGIKIFNNNLESIVAYDFKNEAAPYNISGNNQKYLLSIDDADNDLRIYNRQSNSLVGRAPLNFKYEKGNRRAYQDADGYIYAVDDYYAKKFDSMGNLLASFKHLDYQGFDIMASGNTNYLYFSNGVGVVRLNKEMKSDDYAWTGNMGGYAGWAMGLKVVYNQGDKVVVFNNSNILVLNDKLEKIASISATEEEKQYATENLFLNLDKSVGPVGSGVVLSGGGFLPDEGLVINFNGATLLTTKADDRGRFSTTIKIPNVSLGAYDIKVISNNSKSNYSISFQVK